MNERARPRVPEPRSYYPGQHHADMKRQVDEGFDAAHAGEIADEWKQIGARLTEIAVDFRVILDGSRDGWRGQAGDGARVALAKVGEFSEKTGDHFRSTGDALHRQTSAASEAKKRMPEPIEFDARKMYSDAVRSGNLIQIFTVAVAAPVLKAKSEAAKAEAVQVMQSRDGALHAATTAMPAFAEMPTVIQDQGITSSSDHMSSVITSTADPNTRLGTTNTSTTSTTSTVPTGTQDRTTHTSWAPPPTTGTPPAATPPTQLPPVTPPAGPPGLVPHPPIGTRPPGPPTRPNPPTRATPPGYQVPPGGGRGPGGGGLGARFGGGPGGALGGGPGMGRGQGAGFGPNAGFGPTGSQTGTNPANARGTAVGVMGGTGAGQGQGDEDLEHQAKFLIPSDEYFDDNRLVAPPTIGE